MTVTDYYSYKYSRNKFRIVFGRKKAMTNSVNYKAHCLLECSMCIPQNASRRPFALTLVV